MKSLFLSLLPSIFFATVARAECQSTDGQSVMEFRFLLQGRTVEVKEPNKFSWSPSVFNGINTGKRISDPGSPYDGYTIFLLSDLFGSPSPQIKMAFDRVYPFGGGNTGRAVLFVDFAHGRQILHDFVCDAAH